MTNQKPSSPSPYDPAELKRRADRNATLEAAAEIGAQQVDCACSQGDRRKAQAHAKLCPRWHIYAAIRALKAQP